MYTATTCRLRNRDHVSVWTLTASQRTAAECTRTMLLLARTKLWNVSVVSLAARSGLQNAPSGCQGSIADNGYLLWPPPDKSQQHVTG